MKTRTAWVFPGQGSQEFGMVADLLKMPTTKAKLEQSERILGWSVLELCQSNDAKLSCTLYTQPCLFVVLSILADLIMQQGHKPMILAGYSLGEYVALYTAGVYSFETGLRLVKCRAELMASAPDGTMVLLAGIERKQLEECIQLTPDVAIANDDPDRTIVSGTKQAVEAVLRQVQVKRIIRLNVDKPFHSPLMAHSAAEFRQVLEAVPFEFAQIPVLSGVEPVVTQEASRLKQRLLQQITAPVKWRAVSLELAAQSIERVVEIGPGKFLSSLTQQTCPSLVTDNISNVAQATEFSQHLVLV